MTAIDTLTASLDRFAAAMLAYGAWVADPRDVCEARADVAAAAMAVIADYGDDDETTVMAYAHHGDALRAATHTARITRRMIDAHMDGTSGTDRDPHRDPRTTVSQATAVALRHRAGLAA